MTSNVLYLTRLVSFVFKAIEAIQEFLMSFPLFFELLLLKFNLGSGHLNLRLLERPPDHKRNRQERRREEEADHYVEEKPRRLHKQSASDGDRSECDCEYQ